MENNNNLFCHDYACMQINFVPLQIHLAAIRALLCGKAIDQSNSIPLTARFIAELSGAY